MAKATKRISKALISNMTREMAEKTIGELSRVTSLKAEVEARLEQEITNVRAKYAEQLLELAEEEKEHSAALQLYAETNPELFDPKKSYDLVHGSIGFRTSNPAVKQLTGFTVAASLELAKEFAPEWIRTKEEINKELIIQERDKGDAAAVLKRIGLKVVQEEKFFIELKEEAVTV